MEFVAAVYTNASPALGIAQRRGISKVRHLRTQSLWLHEALATKRVLFEKINHPGLKDVTVALEVQRDISQMSYEHITNHLVTKVSKFDDASSGKFKGRNLSSATTGRKGKVKGPANGGVHMPDGSIWTGFYLNWK